jgi:glycogen debranching enzyme
MTYQQPTLAWGVVKLDARCPDTAFLRQARPALERYVEHWRRDYTRPESGLVCFPARGVCWDDALRWQDRFPVAFQEGEDWASKDWGGMCSTRFENVDTNTHLYLEYRALETICRRLDDAASADQWAARAEALAERINALLYDPERGIYQDRAVADGRFTGMLTLAAFLPVYAGFAPVAAARRMCRRYLLNPDHFNTPMPFCTLDRSHPAFRSGGFLQTVPQVPGALAPQAYWIGRAWPNVNTWMLGALWKAGLKREAEEAAWRLLDTMDRFETTHETYDPLSGMPGGHPECSHGGSAALIYAHGLYKV